MSSPAIATATDGRNPPPAALHSDRVSRKSVAVNGAVWSAYSGMLAAAGVGVAGIGLLFDSYPQRLVLLFALAMAMTAILAAATKPPALGSIRNHLAVASSYVFVCLGMLAFGSGALIPLAAAMFIGPFIAVRLVRRRHIALHMVATSVALLAPVALMRVDGSAIMGVYALLPATWILGLCAMVVLEAAEGQGAELEVLTRRDPLTGAGNRRLLNERLEHEITRHRRTNRQLSVIALDLNGFKALNDRVGHEAGDRLLCDVATALQATCRSGDTLARQGGDEFCLLLPETSPEQARNVEQAVRERLADLPSGGSPVTAGIGIATFPADGSDGDILLNVADQRLRVDKAGPDHRRAARWRVAPTPAPPPRVATPRPERLTRVSRTELAVNPFIWMATRVMFTIATSMTIAFAMFAEATTALGTVLAVYAAVLTVTMWVIRPPRIGTVTNRLLLAIIAIFPAAFIATYPTAAGSALGAATFIGPVTALRLLDRRQIAAHFAFATAVLGGIVAFHAVDQTASLMLLVVALGVLGLGISSTAVLETAEAEGRQLERLVRRDPLTGVGNRRMLAEQLEYELQRHGRTRRPLSVLALDLNGFKAINDELGHAAGDEILCGIAAALKATVRDQDTVVRQGGDEFCVLLPETGASAAPTVAQAIRTRLAAMSTSHFTVSSGIGIATFPDDATSGNALMQIADDRLRAEKTGATSDQLVSK